MAKPHLSERDLRDELEEFRDRYGTLGDDELFVLWFLRAFITDIEPDATAALCGGKNDKGVDAVLIDRAARTVFIVQGKYRQTIGTKNEHRGDVEGFARLALDLCGNGESFRNLTRDMSPEVTHRLGDARKCIRNDDYAVHFYYVTTGRCSTTLQEAAERIVSSVRRLPDAPKHASVSFRLLDGKKILRMLADYLDGVAPPIPSLDLEIEPSGGAGSVLNRHDSKTNIESWVFSMRASAVAGLFERARTRLFARNIRGYLGKTEINRSMEATLRTQPEHFWYYNNGVTIVCDDANLDSRGGRSILHVTNPQVINGQQTTRTLAETTGKAAQASTLVRVIRIPREDDGTDHFDNLVTQIVAATNWQNQIRASDLMSNDRRQIEIERQLRKLNYLYLRKRMTKGEAKRAAGVRHLRTVKKEEFAQAVAGSELDPSIVRTGKEILFEEQYYNRIFPNADPNYYLSRYWLLRLVSYKARGSRERTYAKWLVLHHLWPSLEPLCRARSRAELFRRACEADDAGLAPLYRAVDLTFVAALKFFRKNRGTGREKADVIAFFKRRRLDKEFDVYWRSSNNSARPRFARAWTKFRKEIEIAAST